MKKRRFFALFLVLGLLVSLLSVPASAFEEIDVDARAALLVEKETGEILYEKNAHEKNYPASITKLTVALLVFEAIDAGQLSLDQPITAHESAFEGLSIYGSTAGIKVGEVLTVEQLLQCMLIVSANEACNILAEAVCGEGNISQFVQRMNERAAALGCENTHYVNTSGLLEHLNQGKLARTYTDDPEELALIATSDLLLGLAQDVIEEGIDLDEDALFDLPDVAQ